MSVHSLTDRSSGRRQPQSSPPDRRHRPTVNITPTERTGRVTIGVAAVIFGAILLASAASAVAVVLEVLLIGAGLDLAVTGAAGHCPLYAKLGHPSVSARSSP